MDIDPRLSRRYNLLVKSQIKVSEQLSSGVKSVLSESEAFSQTQAAWRFFNNENCKLTELIKPILTSGLSESEKICKDYCLVSHDWSGLSYKNHVSKKARFGIHNDQELGYELQASLLMSDETGCPISPLSINVVDKNNVFSTYREVVNKHETHLEELGARIKHIEDIGFKKKLVHIIDREGDSVQLMRELAEKYWLIRCRSNSYVEHAGVSLRVDKLAKRLDYVASREVEYRGKKANQTLASADILISRSSKPKKQVNGKTIRIKGRAIPCRLIVSRILDEKGKVLAYWYLVSNVETVDMSTLALWYYWRWSIESFFKLLKSAGMQVESWQQKSAHAIARRLLIACMACVFVWQLSGAKRADAGELRKILIRLSGKQMRYGVDYTKPALFTGLCYLLNTLDILEHYDINELRQMIQNTAGELLV